MKTRNLTFKYIIIISLVFFIFLIGRIYYDYLHQKDMLDNKLNDLNTTINTSLDIATTSLVKNYSILASHFMNSKEVYEYFKNDQREQLYHLLKDDYNNFKKIDTSLFVMHFIDKNNKTVLRMHKPSSYDDDLSKKRPIVAFVNKSLKAQNAFEVGKNGIVYRITTPFIYQGDHIGVLEFGIRLDYFTNILKKNFQVSYSQLVRKDQLNVLVAQKDYPMIDNYAVISQEALFDSFNTMIDLTKNKQIITKNERTYLLCSSNLTDYNGQVVSKILSIDDISDLVDKQQLWFKMVNTSSIIIYLLIIILMYVVLNKFSNELREYIITISKLNKKSKYLQNKANTDSLTQIYNKRYFNKALKLFLKNKNNGSLLFFDIDHFKKINDTHGHLIGDKILQKLSSTVQTHLREEDLFARWGGEEFIILFNSLDLKTSHKKAESIRKLIQNTLFENDIQLTISIGLCEIQENEKESDLLKRADELLYKAKHQGRNCIVS